MVHNKIHIELTTKCNISCAFCLRKKSNFYELPYKDITNFLNKNTLNNLEEIKLCGGLGEPTLHDNFMELISYFKDNKDNIRINISTNGSTHSKDWWVSLSKYLNEKDDVTFGIDGLEDTHKLHRSSDFKKIIDNMSAFISGGGKANWQTIVFKHNQFQLEEIKKIANDVGANFEPKMSGFYNDVFQMPTIDISARPSFVHQTRRKEKDRKCEDEEKCDLLYKRPFLSVLGYLFPCPFLRNYEELKEYNLLTDSKFFIEFLKNKEKLNIRKNSYENIVSSDLFNWVLCNRSNLKTCQTYCGVYKI